MRNIFLEKSHTKCGGETVLRPFAKNSKLSICLDQFLFTVWQLEYYPSLLKLSCRPLAVTSCKYTKKSSIPGLPVSFSA